MNMYISYINTVGQQLNNNHEILEIYCPNCGNTNINDTINTCDNCEYDCELFFVCMNCTEIIKIFDHTNLCPKLIIDKVIKIQKFYKKRLLIKNLMKYNNSLLKLYFHPDSIYIKYYINNFDNNNNKQLAYINNNNKLKILKIIK